MGKAQHLKHFTDVLNVQSSQDAQFSNFSQSFQTFYRLLGGLCLLGAIGGGWPSPALGIQPHILVQTPIAQSVTAQSVTTQTVIAQSQSNPELRQLLRDARENIESGQYNNAITLYTRAAQLDRENPQIFSGIGYAYTQLQRFADAATAFRQAVTLDARNPDLQYGLALSLHKAGDYRGAIGAYQAVIQLDNRPQNRNRTETYLGLGLALAESEDLAGALATYQQLINLQPKEPGLRCGGGNFGETATVSGGPAPLPKSPGTGPQYCRDLH